MISGAHMQHCRGNKKEVAHIYTQENRNFEALKDRKDIGGMDVEGIGGMDVVGNRGNSSKMVVFLVAVAVDDTAD